MKAILEFDLNEPDEREEHLRCVRALDLCLVLWDFDQILRSEIKYNDKDWQEVRDKLTEIMDEHGVNLDDLMS